MRQAQRTTRSRRELFADLGRVIAAGGLAFIGALAMRGGDKGADCADRLFCRDCRILDRCARPEAEAARRGKAGRKS